MGGGLLQLVAYGAQDVYLTGNPQITFFKVVYRRHTNFAMEAIQQTFSGLADFGNTVTCQISRNGDLINRAYLQVDLPALTGTDKYVNYVGLRLLKSVTIEIGGQQIDKHYSDWLYIWNELSLPKGKRAAWELMVGADQDLTSSSGASLYIPLEFWFCRNIGLALPLIALQYHEVKLKIEFETANNCIYKLNGSSTTTPTGSYKISAISLWVDYIFLDTDERRKFAQLSHEYLIEQLQYFSEGFSAGTTVNHRINFNHPCKELVWVAKFSGISTLNQWYNYTVKADNTFASATDIPGKSSFLVQGYDSNVMAFSSNGDTYGGTTNFLNKLVYNVDPGFHSNAVNPFTKGVLRLNGNDRFAEREGTYFNYVQPYQHHTNIPPNCGINVYSFALKPEEHQPSGTLNMSRIDSAILALTNKAAVAGQINIYAVNYNVLRILSGMGGLAYSN
jgi:hypothetical protein